MDNTSKMNNELDQYGVWIKTPPHNAQLAPNENTPEQKSEDGSSEIDISEFDSPDSEKDGEKSEADFSIPDDLFSEDLTLPPMPDPDAEVSAENKSDEATEEIQAEPPVDTATDEDSFKEPPSENPEPTPDIDFEAIANQLNESTAEEEAVTPETKPEAPVSDLADGEISLDAFLDSPDGEISVDSFLGDSSSDTNLQPDGDISLDAFLDASDFGVGPEKQESTTETFEEPLDIDLSFEDTALEFDDGADSDFSDLDAFLEDSSDSSSSSTSVDFENFDAMFDNIEDSAPKAESESAPRPAAGEASFGESESVDLSEFGLADEDSGNIKIGTEEKAKVPENQDYELNIDDNAMDSSEMGSEATEDNVEIELDSKEDENKSLKQDESNPYSAPDNDFDVDSLFDSIVDETDPSAPAAPVEKKPEPSSPVEEKAVEEPSVPAKEIAAPATETENVVEATEDVAAEQADVSTEPSEIIEEKEDNPVEPLDAVVESISLDENPSENVESTEEQTFPEPAEANEAVEPVEETEPVESSPVEENPVEENPAEEIPVEENPVEESQSQESPAEENPVVENDGPDFEALEQEDLSIDSVNLDSDTDSAIETNGAMDDNKENVEEDSMADVEVDSVALDDFMGSEGFSDPSICEGNRSYSPEELEEQRRAKKLEDSNLVVDATEGETSNDVVEDEEVFPSPFYSPLVESEGKTAPSFEDSDSANDEDEESDGDGVFDLDADSIVPADMSDLDYDENTGIRPAENSNEIVAENENTGDNIDSIDDGVEPENTNLPEAAIETAEENKDTIPDAGEEQMDTNTNDQVSENTNLIKQIAAELSSLREEINELKSEFAEFKNGKSAIPEPVPSDSEPEKESGFFSDMDDDDTIALSGDELSNILSSAEFTPAETEAATEEPLFGSVEDAAAVPDEDYDNNLKVDFDNEKLEEPNLDDVQLDDTITSADETLPTEIDVPKVDESFDEPAMDSEPSVEESTEESFEAPSLDSETEESETTREVASDEEPVLTTEPELTEETETESTEPEQESFEAPEPEVESVFEPESKNSESIDAQVDNSITQADYNYLAEDEAAQETPEEDEKLETGISEEPVNTVFNKWEASNPEGEENPVEESVEEDFQEPVSAEIAPEETESTADEQPETFEEPVSAPVDEAVNEEPVADSIESEPKPEEPAPSSGVCSIPEEMKQEIKSVLAYMDQLLESLPEDKIAEFAQSEQFSTYKKLFNELGLS
ncbi:MAG: hypothetical protein IKP60_00815 [Treponema sp.]|nr:hypothetical protein [Treponema sp.]